ncbi:tetratricopeptide repeat-containing sensor histidine kinase [Hyunsoonleella ulvae]|uniref:tetratricopeptide repeat-containing sensor histidine kinase n=1 Tax=Hyunsoonleella ulvae TaxID=2799948 RepID=UPI00193A3A48|nr:tetratricopeptide repeat-containing sensor histidine kinase [Hyunsoonleella ulvae]
MPEKELAPHLLLELSKKQSKLDDQLSLLNKAFKISQQRKLDSIHLTIIFKKSIVHLGLHQKDSFCYYNKLLLKQSQTLNNKHYNGRAFYNLGYYYDEFTTLSDSTFYYYSRAKNNFIAIRDSSKVGKSLLSIALLQKNQTNFFSAKESLTEAIIYLNKNTDKKYLASAYNELGTNNLKLLNYSDAIRYHKKAIEITESKSDVISYKNNLAFSYIEKNRHVDAIPILQKILKDSLLQKDSELYARALHNLSYAQWLNGNKKVLPAFLKALHIRKEINDKRGQLQSYTDLAKYHSKTNPDKASKYLDTLILISKVLRSPRAETDALKLYMALYPKQVTYKDRYIFLKDSLYNQELKVKTQFAKMQYDDEQEKAQIQQLQQQAVEEKAALAVQKTQKTLFLSLSGLLLIAGISLYYALRQRHKKEKLKEVYKTEQLISKRLHDELSNDIYGLMATIEQNPNKDKNYLLDNLEKIYGQTRSISHDNREIATGAAFAEELKDALSTFYNKETNVVVSGLNSISWENLSDHKCIAIHRTLKEFMVNMKKHSEATVVAINFKNESKLIRISYSDNGIGLQEDQKLGVGLKNTVSRIEGVNGKITFDSETGNGTTITITIPK